MWSKRMSSGFENEFHIESHKGKALNFVPVWLCNRISPTYYEEITHSRRVDQILSYPVIVNDSKQYEKMCIFIHI